MHENTLKVPTTPCSENVPDSQFFTYSHRYYHLFKQNVLRTHIKKTYTILNMICGKYLEPLQKCWTGVPFVHLSLF